jgi:hypothetical protein
VAVLIGLSLPGLAIALFCLAMIEGILRWLGKQGIIPWLRHRTGRSLSATAFDEYTTVFDGSKRIEIDQRDEALMLRQDEASGAPPGSESFEVDGVRFVVRNATDRPEPD